MENKRTPVSTGGHIDSSDAASLALGLAIGEYTIYGLAQPTNAKP